MDSDDDMDLLEYLHEFERSGPDPLLFSRPDGLPMAFDNLDSDDYIKEIINECGGIVVDRDLASDIFKEHLVKICSRDTAHDISEEVFDKQFIYDSLKTNSICNLDNYRLNKCAQVYGVAYDPTDVLLGYKEWNDVKLLKEVKQEDSDSSLPSTIEIKKDDRIIEDYDVEQIGSLKTEDEIWESRAPDAGQVLISQDSEKELVGTSDFEIEDNDLEQIGSLKTEDEIWESRAPDQVFVSQDSEKELVGTSDLEIENCHLETENADLELNSPQPDFVSGLLYGKFM